MDRPAGFDQPCPGLVAFVLLKSAIQSSLPLPEEVTCTPWKSPLGRLALARRCLHAHARTCSRPESPRSGGDGFGINIAPDEDAQVPAWRQARKYTFPLVLAGAEDFARMTYGVSVAPVNLLLNGEGRAICRYSGVAPDSELMLEAEIRELLGLDALAGLTSPKAGKPVKK